MGVKMHVCFSAHVHAQPQLYAFDLVCSLPYNVVWMLLLAMLLVLEVGDTI
jgi:hypothetical protein